MSKAEKRERQRQNRITAREQEAAVAKRRRTWRSARLFALFLIPIVVIFVVIKLTSSGSSTPEKPKATTTTKAAPSPTTAAATSGTTAASPTKSQLLAPTGIAIDTSKTYTAVIETTEGPIEIALDAKAAPVSVNNFVYLAKAGWYDGLAFNRAVKNFVIQTGSSNDTTAGGGPGYTVKAEVPAGNYEVGSVAWAKTGAEPAGTAGSQFFIGTGSQVTTLPRDYGYLGKVTKGLDVAQKIMGFAPASGDGSLTTRVVMTKVTIVES